MSYIRQTPIKYKTYVIILSLMLKLKIVNSIYFSFIFYCET